VAGDNYPNAFTIRGYKNNSNSNLYLRVLRSLVSNECWFGFGSGCAADDPDLSDNARANTGSFGVGYNPKSPGTYYIVGAASETASADGTSEGAKCTGNPFGVFPSGDFQNCSEDSVPR